MRQLLLLGTFLCGVSAVWANGKFDGRWDLTVTGEPRGRAWWLEIQGAGTAQPKGTFISAYAGDLNVIEELTIAGNELTFGFKPKDRGHLVYKARLTGDTLEGVFLDNGKQRFTFRGVRAPEIAEKDDGSWKKGKPVELFNGRDMTGWKPLLAGVPLGWKVAGGILTNEPKANNLISDSKFWNFELHVEYRVGPHSNSGIGLRGRYEIQILEDHGKPPDTHSNGALYSRVAPTVNASRPAGEWQTYDIRLVGRTVTVVLNGKKILDKVHIDGLTAVAMNADEAEPGPFILQGDHGAVEFRKITLTPLTR